MVIHKVTPLAMDLEELREKAYKVVAYSSIGFSMIAVLSVSITLPMVYHYVERIQIQMDADVGFCRVSIGRLSLILSRQYIDCA